MKKIHLLAVLLCCFTFSTSTSADIYFFGDSLTDSGNVFNITGGATPPAPYFNGRFSNGPTWAEVFAEQTGASAIASTSGGTNYAFGGARTGSSFPPIYLLDQVNAYVNNGAPGGSADLFVVWAGSNDIFDAAVAGDPASVITSAVTNIANSIGTLQATGAENFLVINSVALGQTPFYQAYDDATISALNSLSAMFNLGLAAQIPTLESSLGIDILEVEMYSFLLEVQADPASYGLTNAIDSVTPFDPGTALSTGGPTGDPDDFLFWDGIHPTAAGHRLLANRVFLATVPEPSSVVLLATCGIALCFRRKKKGSGLFYGEAI